MGEKAENGVVLVGPGEGVEYEVGDLGEAEVVGVKREEPGGDVGVGEEVEFEDVGVGLTRMGEGGGGGVEALGESVVYAVEHGRKVFVNYCCYCCCCC